MAVATDAATGLDVGRSATTVASLARDRAASAPGQVAMRDKEFGIWQEYKWGRLWERVLDAAHGLLALDLDVGDRVSIHSEDRPEWVILDLATVAVRAITVGLYPTNPTVEVRYTLTDSGTSVHLAEDQEQVDKVLSVDPAELPNLRHILFVEPRGVRSYRDPRLLFWDDFLARGRAHREAFPDAVERRMAEAEPTDVMTLVYTSGTTGPPKGAMLTNANASFCIDKIVDAPGRFRGNRPPGTNDMILTYLPLCHIAERIFSTWHLVSRGTVLNFAESIETVAENLREVQPTLFFAVPRIWEKLHATVLIKGKDATRVKRAIFGFGMRLAGRIGDIKAANGGQHTAVSRLLYAVGWVLVFRPLRERVGLRRCRWAGSGAAPIAPEVLKFFIGLGVPVYELGIGFRIDEPSGEIQTRHDGVFAGYWGKPEATEATFTDDAWLKTGDVGEWVDGTHVRIVDRIKHIIITSGGKNISPSEIENDLKTSPYIKEAMVIGDRRSYVTALIGIELDTVGNWALRQSIPYTTYRDLTEKPEVVALIKGEIDKTNERFSRVENIRKFRLLPKELDHEDGELTATQKLKRGAMEDAFAGLVESMYA